MPSVWKLHDKCLAHIFFPDSVEDMGSFEGTQAYTYKWTIRELRQKIEQAVEEGCTIACKPIEVKGSREQDKLALALALVPSVEFEELEGGLDLTWNSFLPHLAVTMQPSTDRPHVRLWWHVKVRSAHADKKTSVVDFGVQMLHVSSTEKPSVKKAISAKNAKVRSLGDAPSHTVILDLEVLWPSWDDSRWEFPKMMTTKTLALPRQPDSQNSLQESP